MKRKSSHRPLGQFQPNLTLIILRQSGFKFVEMKGHILIQGEIAQVAKMRHYIESIQKSSTPDPLGPFKPNLAQIILW